jgi:hypothetical protein
MDDGYPVEESVYVLKEGRKLGPFDIENLFDGLEEGAFTYDDICLREGATECERLRDILDWERARPSGPRRPSGSLPETEPLKSSEADDEDDDSIFIDGERLLYAGHPSIASSPLALFFVVGGITGGIWLYALDLVFTAAGFGLALLGLAWLSFMRFTQDYRITPRRIEVITGFLARSSNEVRIEDIRAINVTCRGFTGMIGIGTVDFFTSGDSAEVTFRKIWAATKVKALVRRLQDTL